MEEESRVDVTMPQLGETVTEGTITRWLKQVGDRVEADEPLFEVSTDKVDSEVPAPTGGVVTEILVAEGETVEVGTRLAIVGAAPAAPAAPPAPAAEAPAPQAPAPETPAPAPEPEPAPVAEVPAPAEPAPEPETAPTAPISFSAPSEPAPEAPAVAAPAATDGGADALTSPIVRRLVAE